MSSFCMTKETTVKLHGKQFKKGGVRKLPSMSTQVENLQRTWRSSQWMKLCDKCLPPATQSSDWGWWRVPSWTLGSTTLAGPCSHSDVCWKRKVLECTEDNIVVRVTDSSFRGEALLDQVLTDALNFIIQDVGQERQEASLAKTA